MLYDSELAFFFFFFPFNFYFRFQHPFYARVCPAFLVLCSKTWPWEADYQQVPGEEVLRVQEGSHPGWPGQAFHALRVEGQPVSGTSYLLSPGLTGRLGLLPQDPGCVGALFKRP